MLVEVEVIWQIVGTETEVAAPASRIKEGGVRVDVGTADSASYNHAGVKNRQSCSFKGVYVDAEWEFYFTK